MASWQDSYRQNAFGGYDFMPLMQSKPKTFVENLMGPNPKNFLEWYSSQNQQPTPQNIYGRNAFGGLEYSNGQGASNYVRNKFGGYDYSHTPQPLSPAPLFDQQFRMADPYGTNGLLSGGNGEGPSPMGDAPVGNMSGFGSVSPGTVALGALGLLGGPIGAIAAQAISTMTDTPTPMGLAMNALGSAFSDSPQTDPADAAIGVSLGGDSTADAVGAAAAGAAADAVAAAEAQAEGGGTSGDSKIVCTAMNAAYGFGSFRQAVWLEYSDKKLTKEHERGYHAIFRPLVKYGFNAGNGWSNRMVRRVLEYIMRLRTADLRAEMRGTNPRPVIRCIRRAAEGICYYTGRMTHAS